MSILNLVGAVIIAYDMLQLNDEKAIEQTTRTREKTTKNSKEVQYLLIQAKYTKWGLLFISIGFACQFISQLC